MTPINIKSIVRYSIISMSVLSFSYWSRNIILPELILIIYFNLKALSDSLRKKSTEDLDYIYLNIISIRNRIGMIGQITINSLGIVSIILILLIIFSQLYYKKYLDNINIYNYGKISTSISIIFLVLFWVFGLAWFAIVFLYINVRKELSKRSELSGDYFHQVEK